MTTYHLLIQGEVQGVFFRDSARKEALKLGISGWVKNLENGDVELMVQGDESSLHQFLDWCKQGPPKAVVRDVVLTKKEGLIFHGFKID
jgi:acylphosphatase